MEWSQGILLLGLLLGAVMDIREKQISVIYIGMIGILGVLNQIFLEHSPVPVVLGGLGVGLVFIVLSKASRGDIGMGDGLLIGALGIYLGFWKILLLIGYGLFLSGIFSLLILIVKKNRHLGIPFVPFLCIGYLWMVVS